MKASERTLEQLLHAADQYVIPAFQRYYTWGTDNWDQLLDDLAELLDPEQPQKRHFIGAIVTVPDNPQPGSVPAYQVIDGQQRLTTLSLLLLAMRTVAQRQGWAEMAAEIEENYLVHRFKRGREHYKVYPRLRDRKSYLALVDNNGQEAAGGQIEAAYRYFVKRVEQAATTEALLRQWLTAMTGRLDFVAITLGAENPYKIFRSLNSTGVELTEADLIRNHVFMALPVDEQDDFDNGLWRSLENHFVVGGRVSGRDFEAFLRDALMRDGTYIGKDGTFEGFEKRHPAGRFEPQKVVADLVRVAKLYDYVRGRQAHPIAEIEQALDAVRKLNVTTAYPLLTTVLERHAANELSQAKLLSIVRAVASFVLRRFVCGRTSRAYSSWFVTACRNLGVDPEGRVLGFFREKGWPADDEFKARFVRFNLYSSKYDRSVLGSLELASQAKSEPVVLDGCTIEHVMPQTIEEDEADGKAWVAGLGEAWKAVHGEWLHTPGNLTLVGADYNVTMSNRAFEVKRTVLAGSRVYLNKHFQTLTVATWAAGEIEARGKALAELAVRVWPGPGK